MAVLTGPEEKRLSAAACRVVHPWISAEMYELLEREAAARGSHPDRLAGDILIGWLLEVVSPRQRGR